MSAYLLNSMDLELIFHLKNNLLFPSNEDEFWEALKYLDKDNFVYERIMSHTSGIYKSITDFYKTEVKPEVIQNIIKSI